MYNKENKDVNMSTVQKCHADSCSWYDEYVTHKPKHKVRNKSKRSTDPQSLKTRRCLTDEHISLDKL